MRGRRHLASRRKGRCPVSDDVRVELVDPQGQLLAELGTPGVTRDSVALTYAFALRADSRGEAIDWPVINRAIIGRWSESALVYIKTKAWKRVEGGAR
jgi:hypothetical protein